MRSALRSKTLSWLLSPPSRTVEAAPVRVPGAIAATSAAISGIGSATSGNAGGTTESLSSATVVSNAGASSSGCDAALIARRSNCVFLGTSVRSGSARVLVVHTGRDTAFGEVAARLAAPPPESDFARGVRHFGGMLMRVMIVMVLFVLVVNQLLGRAPLDSLLFASRIRFATRTGVLSENHIRTYW